MPRNWTLSPALLHELQALPDIPLPASVQINDCKWPEGAEGTLQQLPSLIPTCYGALHLHEHLYIGHVNDMTAQHIMAVCMGTAARMQGGERLRLKVACDRVLVSDEQRFQVEACVDEKGLRECVEVKWC